MLFTYLIIPAVLIFALIMRWANKKYQRWLSRRMYIKMRDSIILNATPKNQDAFRSRIKSLQLHPADTFLLYQFLNQTIEAVGYEAAGVVK